MSDPDLTSCKLDRDCAAGMLCYNANSSSWLTSLVPGADANGTCLCNAWYGWGGPACTELSAGSYLLAITCALQICVALGICAFSVQDLMKLFANGKVQMTAGMRTTVSLVLVSLTIIIWSTCVILAVVRPQDFNEIPGGEEKFSFWTVMMRPAVFATTVLTVFCAVNVSVMWVEVAFNARSMRQGGVTVQHYKYASYGFLFLFSAVQAALAAVGKWDLAAVAAQPFMIVLLVVFLVGRRRMLAVLDSSLQLSLGTSGTGSKDNSETGKEEKAKQQKLRRAMDSIQRCSLHVCLGIFGLAISGVVYFVFNSLLAKVKGTGGAREFARYGQFSWLTPVTQCIVLSIIYINFTIFLYTHRGNRKIIKQAQGASSTQHSSASKEEPSFQPSRMEVSFLAPAKGAGRSANSHGGPEDV
jgi:hypothetical protein